MKLLIGLIMLFFGCVNFYSFLGAYNADQIGYSIWTAACTIACFWYGIRDLHHYFTREPS